MSQFLTSLTWHQIGVQKYILDAPLVFKSDLLGGIITAPYKFITDGESSPRWLPIINSIFGNCTNEGAVIHDLLYYVAIFKRLQSDQVLKEAMDLIPGIEKWRVNGIYNGLRAVGWWAWMQHRKLNHSAKDFGAAIIFTPN